MAYELIIEAILWQMYEDCLMMEAYWLLWFIACQ